MSEEISNTNFVTKTGTPLRGATPAMLENMNHKLHESYGISQLQVVEEAGFSMAMVVRFALGLSALEGQVCALVNDSLSGAIALTTLRHLINGGSNGVILFVGKSIKENNISELLAKTLQPHEQMNTNMEYWHESSQHSLVQDLLIASHNTICGLYRPNMEQSIFEAEAVQVLNETSTPIHTIQSPLGVSPLTGEKSEEPLFASSTLSLGAPLIGLENGAQYTGRHYLCDISYSRPTYQEEGLDYPPLFAEQPVIQILPKNEAK